MMSRSYIIFCRHRRPDEIPDADAPELPGRDTKPSRSSALVSATFGAVLGLPDAIDGDFQARRRENYRPGLARRRATIRKELMRIFRRRCRPFRF